MGAAALPGRRDRGFTGRRFHPRPEGRRGLCEACGRDGRHVYGLRLAPGCHLWVQGRPRERQPLAGHQLPYVPGHRVQGAPCSAGLCADGEGDRLRPQDPAGAPPQGPRGRARFAACLRLLQLCGRPRQEHAGPGETHARVHAGHRCLRHDSLVRQAGHEVRRGGGIEGRRCRGGGPAGGSARGQRVDRGRRHADGDLQELRLPAGLALRKGDSGLRTDTQRAGVLGLDRPPLPGAEEARGAHAGGDSAVAAQGDLPQQGQEHCLPRRPHVAVLLHRSRQRRSPSDVLHLRCLRQAGKRCAASMGLQHLRLRHV
mmetsp:Transcript_38498/g.119677  ORF Transcript_38498/g.119677 Transcript_38498/m.119677 type:complete len:314 (+) Transcript_38498:181-1122(+)